MGAICTMKINQSDVRRKQYLRALKRVPLLNHAVRHTPEGSSTREDINRLVLGPTIHGYIVWLLASALNDGVQRLYFLARDGYLPYQIASEICRRLKLPIECRYFYCSRAALRIPMYHRDIPQALDHICRGGLHVTPERIMLRAGLETAQARAIYSLLALPWAWDEVIPYARLGEIKKQLASNEAFLKAMIQASVDAFPALDAYFRQTGILEAGHFAVVDSGWTGTMQRSIMDICSVCQGQAALRGYYFGLYYLPKECDPDLYSSFYFGPDWGLRNKVLLNNNLFETVFSAPHGTVTGYRQLEHGVEPLLNAPRPEIRDYIQGFAKQTAELTRVLLEELTVDKLAAIPTAQLRSMSTGLLRRFMYAPTKLEAENFGTLPFSDDLHDAGTQQLAEKLTARELWQHHVIPRILKLLGLGTGETRQSAWFEGSAARCCHFNLWHLLSYHVYKLLLYSRRR